MKILFSIPHYFRPLAARTTNKSHRKGAKKERIQALAQTVYSIYRLFGKQVFALDHYRKKAWNCPPTGNYEIDVTVCTTGSFHLLENLPFLKPLVEQHNSTADPLFLGYECHKLFAKRQDDYDYFCYVEDDIILTDPLMFKKLALFSEAFREEALLQPNRYEIAINGPAHKLYCDYHVQPEITVNYQNVKETPELFMPFLGEKLRFIRTCYPSAGSFYLNQKQMKIFANSSAFLDGDQSYMSPLDSAATLGITKTFSVYKPALSNASFLEVLHASPRWIRIVGQQVPTASWDKHPRFIWEEDHD